MSRLFSAYSSECLHKNHKIRIFWVGREPLQTVIFMYVLSPQLTKQSIQIAEDKTLQNFVSIVHAWSMRLSRMLNREANLKPYTAICVHPPQLISQLCCPVLELARPFWISFHKMYAISWRLEKATLEFLEFLKRCFSLCYWSLLACWLKFNLLSYSVN